MTLHSKRISTFAIMKIARPFKSLLFAACVMFYACERNITIDLPQGAPQLVVEGYIEAGRGPIVQLSKSSGFFDVLDSNATLSLAVKGAAVTVSDGITTVNLTEAVPGQGYLYIDATNTMIGMPGKVYTLTVTAEGQTLTAVTKITEPVGLDSLWFKVDGTRDSLGFVWAKLTDPDTIGNSYRWFAQRLGKDESFVPAPNSVFEDVFINGKSFDFAYDRGPTANDSLANSEPVEEARFFKVGDTIVVKFCTIDQDHFRFWRSYINQNQSNGNPFAAPAPINHNVVGGLGIWGGYTPFIDTVIAR
ncbi:MAG: hypothetical protein RIQ89_1900 [Bacteroidota bacterium]